MSKRYFVEVLVSVEAEDQNTAWLIADNIVYEGIGRVPTARLENIAEPELTE